MMADIQTNGFEVTPAIRAQVDKTAAKILKLDERVMTINVFLEIQKRKDDNGCAVTYKIGCPGRDIVVKEKGVNLYDCLSQAQKSVTREVRKEKEKNQPR